MEGRALRLKVTLSSLQFTQGIMIILLRVSFVVYAIFIAVHEVLVVSYET